MSAQAVRRVFLDMLHWVGLAKARIGHRDGRQYRPALEVLEAAVRDGRIQVPLSGVHYMEMTDIKDVRQRADIALTMDRLSRYVTVADRGAVLRISGCPTIAQPTPSPNSSFRSNGEMSCPNHSARARVASARLYIWDLADLLPAALAFVGLTREQFLDTGRAGLQGVLDLMPSMAVEQALRRANFKNGFYSWTHPDATAVEAT